MTVVAPSLTYSTRTEYDAYMAKLQDFAQRIHVDLTDGDLAPSVTVGVDQIWWPDSLRSNIHLMYRHPTEYLSKLIELQPELVIIHLDAKGNLREFGRSLQSAGIKFGVSLMSSAQIEQAADFLEFADHALIFSGHLGFYGGIADFSRISDASKIRRLYPRLEIGWDGGANEHTAAALASAGIDVINVGSGIAATSDPAQSYAKINEVISNSMLENGGQL